ncbi:MAG: hypothetical protein ACXVFT_24280 [Solirubrobacteraceae bacterium]
MLGQAAHRGSPAVRSATRRRPDEHGRAQRRRTQEDVPEEVERGQRRADVRDTAGRVDGGGDVAYRVPSGGAQYLPAPSDLHEHLLGGGALEAGTLQRAAGRDSVPAILAIT